MMLFKIWRLNHTHEHSGVRVLTHAHSLIITSTTQTPQTDSVVQQLTKDIHSYFAVLFAECHCTRPAQSGRGTASTIQLLRTEPREGCSWKNTSEAIQPACWSARAAWLTNVTCDILPRCEAGST